MPRWSKVLALVVLVVAAASVGLWALRGQIALAAMERIYGRALASDPYAGLEDGLHVTLCGAGSPLPDPTRSGPCTAVLAGRRLFIVDAGAGAARSLLLMNLPPNRVEAAFLTHFHSDHIDGLGELLLQRWAGGAQKAPLPVYGPTGVDQVVDGFEAAYTLDRGYRVAHHGPEVTPPAGFGGDPRPFAPGDAETVLIDDGGLRVVAFPVAHAPAAPAVGYRFDYKGRSVVISGDTAASPRLEAAARDADLLVHEGLSPRLVAMQARVAAKGGQTNIASILHDIPSYHAAPEEVAGLAQRAGVRYLLFTHIIPPLPVPALEGPWLGEARKIYRGPVRVGRDGDLISLPADTREIRRGSRRNAVL